MLIDSYSFNTLVEIHSREEATMGIGPSCLPVDFKRSKDQNVFDLGFLDYLKSKLSNLGMHGLLVLGEGNSVSLDDEAVLISHLSKFGFAVQVIRGIRPGNSISCLHEKAKQVKGRKPNWILAIGGGSVIDAGKVLSIWQDDSPSVLEWHEPCSIWHERCFTSSVPVIAVPTCLGSGAEISNLAEITFTCEQIKMPVVADGLSPIIALIDFGLCGTVPWGVQAAAIVDVLLHLVDPLISSSGRNYKPPQVETSVHLAAQLVDLVNGVGRLDRNVWLHKLAWISHLAIRPGIGRSGDVSVAHRIEHIISPRLGFSHGEGLTKVVPHLISSLEKIRHSAWVRISAHLTLIFGESAAPEILLRRFFNKLGFHEGPLAGNSYVASEISAAVMHWFGLDGKLPGPLRLEDGELTEIVRRVINPPPSSPVLCASILSESQVDSCRLFGQPVKGEWDLLIITPVPPIANEINSCFSGRKARGWFESNCYQDNNNRILIVCTPPGATLALDTLNFLKKSGAYFDRVVFLGLAGALRGELPLGGWSIPNEIVSYTSLVGDRRSPLHMQKGSGSLVGCLGSGPVGNYASTCASVESISSETDELLDYWFRLGIDIVDLESATIQNWCDKNKIIFETLLIISDHPRTGAPLWSQPALHPIVERSVAKLAEQFKLILEGT